ncbi:MAG: PGRS family protein [Polyangiaceae bacterium]
MIQRKSFLFAVVPLIATLLSLTAGCFFAPPPCEGCGDPAIDVCIPAEATSPPPDACGVFVSASASPGGDGTKDSPFGTLAVALSGAQPGDNVYACGEVFREPVLLPAGLHLYGGLDCADGFWYAPDRARTEISPPPGQLALRVLPGDGETHIVDVRIVAAAATEPGASSIAALVDHARVVFVRSSLVAGDAADGASGAPFALAALPGADGLPGSDACLAALSPGAPSPSTTCEGGFSKGGAGGDGALLTGSDGVDGAPFVVANHGLGETSNGAPCAPGWSGSPGAPGSPGLGATGLGLLHPAGYTGPPAEDGAPGAIAQGGGGGGGARGGSGPAACGFGSLLGGASGGSGASGGCGGSGGRAGAPGGASIALVSLFADLTFENTSLIAARAGDGGSGGPGQLGGKGGKPGKGGFATGSLSSACAGGSGGQGGQGGRGGGGSGGHSAGIAFAGGPLTLSGASISVSSPGQGGSGEGPPGTGAAGIAAATLELPGP